MNEVRRPLGEPMVGEYASPKVDVVLFQPEGVLCSSVMGISHEDFSEGEEYTI